MKRYVCIVIATIVVLALGACAPATPQVIEKPVVQTVVVEKQVTVEKQVVQTVIVEKPAPTVPQVLRIRVPNPITNVMPHLVGGEDSYITSYSFSPPYWKTPGGKTKPGFALSHEWRQDGLQVTLHLDPKAVFSNGKPITAKAVKKCWEFGLQPEHQNQYGNAYSMLSAVQGVDDVFSGKAKEAAGFVAKDDQTLIINFNSPPYGFDDLMSFVWLGVYDADEAEKNYDQFKLTPVTSGPYVAKLNPETGVATAELNPNWWGPKPNITKIETVVINDDTAALIAFANREFDILNVYLGIIERFLPQWPKDQLIEGGQAAGQWSLAFNCTLPPTDDPWVRRALLHSIDRHAAVASLAPNTFAPVDTLCVPGFPCYDAKNASSLTTYDLALAKQELAKSKYATSMPPITAYYSSGRAIFGDFLALFQDQWRKGLGVEVAIKGYSGQVPADANIKRVSFGALVADEKYYVSEFGRPKGSMSVSFGKCGNDELEAILAKADTLPVTQQAERCTLYNEAEKKYMEDAMIIPLVMSRGYMAWQPYVKMSNIS